MLITVRLHVQTQVMGALYGDDSLAMLLQQPRIRTAIAEIAADPSVYESKYLEDGEVGGALELLQARLGIVDTD